MSSERTKRLRRAVRWLVPAAMLALVPKCLVCVVAYAGLASALGLRGVEICSGSSGRGTASEGWGLAMLFVGAVTSAIVVFRTNRADAPQPDPTRSDEKAEAAAAVVGSNRVAAQNRIARAQPMGTKYLPTAKDQKANERFHRIELRKSKANGAKETRPDSTPKKK